MMENYNKVKILLIIIIGFLLSNPSFAGILGTKVNAGVNWYNINNAASFSKLTDSKYLLGYQAGLYAHAGNKFGGAVGLNWMMLRFEGTNDMDVTQNITTNYFQLPLDFVYMPVDKQDDEKFSVKILTGVSANWRFRVKDNNLGVTRDDIKSTVWGWRIGGGFRFHMIEINAIYDLGVSTVIEGVPDTKHRLFSLTASVYLFEN